MADPYRVIIQPRALADLEAIHQYIAQDSPQNADSFLRLLVDALDSLEELPHRYPVYQGRRRPSESVRRMPVLPYLVFFRVLDTPRAVEVITIRHGARGRQRRFR